MMLLGLLLSAFAAIGSPQAAGAGDGIRASGFWILACEMPAAGAGDPADGLRTFRLGPGSFQERKAGRDSFGSNLCNSFACVAEGRRMQGSISSASLILTIELDPQTRSATWRTVGASGLTKTTGPCSVQPEPPGRAR
jgi:hypothetical protein